MGLALTQVGKRQVFGARRVVTFDVTFDSSYADDGESLTAAMCGLSNIVYVHSSVAVDSGRDTGYLVGYDYTASKLLILNGGTTDAPFEEGGQDDLSTFSCRIQVEGN